jgi:hypothetical protein
MLQMSLNLPIELAWAALVCSPLGCYFPPAISHSSHARSINGWCGLHLANLLYLHMAKFSRGSGFFNLPNTTLLPTL